MKKLLFLLSLLSIIFSQSQTQIGGDIDGEAQGDASGYSVSISSDGTIVAIGAISNDGNGTESGHVRIYENQLGSWVQIGADIDSEAADDASGYSISLSSNGSIVAIGAVRNDGNGSNSGHVRIYENQLGGWVQLGSDIDGEAPGDISGYSVSLSSDGSIVAIGAIGNAGNGVFSGHVRIYENQLGSWVQIGADIDSEAADDFSGCSVSLSSDGTIVAVGARFNDGNGSNSGHVRIYENQLGSWVQIGADIDGEASNDESGHSVRLSSDGSVVAIGAHFNNGNGSNSGHVRIYENQLGSWVQIGADIDGEASGDQSGHSIDLSSEGSIVAIGALNNDGNGANSGHVRIYQNQMGSWVQIGIDIDGEAVGDYSGFSVNLSSDGYVVAIGANENDGINPFSGLMFGHVRVFDLSSIILSAKSFELDYFTVYPNPAKKVLNVKLDGGLELNKINIYNNLGAYLQSVDELQINTSKLSSGVYFIEVETNKGKSAKKIVIE